MMIKTIQWEKDRVKCAICRFNDNHQDMVETPEGICHLECLKDKANGNLKDNRNGDSNAEREQ